MSDSTNLTKKLLAHWKIAKASGVKPTKLSFDNRGLAKYNLITDHYFTLQKNHDFCILRLSSTQIIFNCYLWYPISKDITINLLDWRDFA